jgi:hypothetical protein
MNRLGTYIKHPLGRLVQGPRNSIVYCFRCLRYCVRGYEVHVDVGNDVRVNECVVVNQFSARRESDFF